MPSPSSKLLVVIAIIAILAAMLMSVAVPGAKDQARNVNCLSNLKQLTPAAFVRRADNNDFLVPNNSVAGVEPAASSAPPTTMFLAAGSDAPIELDPSNIVNGLLFPYNKSLPIYHCPADQSVLQTPDGTPAAPVALAQL